MIIQLEEIQFVKYFAWIALYSRYKEVVLQAIKYAMTDFFQIW